MEGEDAGAVERKYTSLLSAKKLYIEKIESKGRCIFTSHNISTGTEVLSEEPYLAALKQVRTIFIN